MNLKMFVLCGLNVCAALMFSGLFIVTPLAIGGVGAVGLATQRFVLVAMIFAAVFATRVVRCEKIGHHHWPWLTLAAFLGIFSYNIGLFHGIALSSVVHGGLIVGFTPIMTLFLEALVFRVWLSAVKLLGAGISLLGVFYFFWSRLDGMAFTALKGNMEFAGDLLFMLAGLCWAGYSLVMRRVTASLNPLVATFYSVIVGAIMLLVWSAISLDHMPISLAMFTLPVLYMAIFGTVIAFMIWFNSVDRIGAARTNIFLNFVPISTVVLAWSGLAAEPTATIRLSLAMVIFAVVLVQLSDMNMTPPPLARPGGKQQSGAK